MVYNYKRRSGEVTKLALAIFPLHIEFWTPAPESLTQDTSRLRYRALRPTLLNIDPSCLFSYPLTEDSAYCLPTSEMVT